MRDTRDEPVTTYLLMRNHWLGNELMLMGVYSTDELAVAAALANQRHFVKMAKNGVQIHHGDYEYTVTPCVVNHNSSDNVSRRLTFTLEELTKGIPA